MESQKMAAHARTEQDVLGFARSGGEAAVQLFQVREGKIVARDVFILDNAAGAADAEVLSAFLKQYYAASGSVPPRVLVPELPSEHDELEAFLSSRRGHNVSVAVPQRGRNRELAALASRNATETLNREQ